MVKSSEKPKGLSCASELIPPRSARGLEMENWLTSPEYIDDPFLVREVQNGNRQAFDELVRRHDRAILRLEKSPQGGWFRSRDGWG